MKITRDGCDAKKRLSRDAIKVEFLPPYSPELYAKRYPLGQPAERLWSLVDEPLVNQYFGERPRVMRLRLRSSGMGAKE